MSPLNEEAGWVTAAIVGIASAWKLFFRGKRDLREDRKGEDTQSAYEALLDELQETVERQGAQLIALGKKLDDEIAKRWATQEENAQLRLRIIHLEHEVRRLGGTVTPTERNSP